MPHWNRTIKLADLVAQWKQGALSIPGLADKVADRIEKSGWLADTPYPDTLRDHLGALRTATDPHEYIRLFDPIYDVADADRVWIETN